MEIYIRTLWREEIEFSAHSGVHMRHLQLDYIGFSLTKAE